MPMKKQNAPKRTGTVKSRLKLSMREINEEIEASRREKDPLHGQTRRISFALSERIYRQLKAAADAYTGSSISSIVRQALGDYLKQTRPPDKPAHITKAISESTRDFKTGRYEP